MSGAHCAGERGAVAGRGARRHIAGMAMTKLLIERSSEVVDATAVARARWWRRAIARARAGFRTPAIGATLPTTLVLEDNVAMSLHVRELPFSIRCVEGCVVITHPADPGDHVLTPGLEFHATGRGQVVAVTFAPTRLVVSR
jgi:DUF2917 family protein